MNNNRKLISELYPDWHSTLSDEEWHVWDRMSWHTIPDPPLSAAEKDVYKAIIKRVELEISSDRAVGYFYDLGFTWWAKKHDPDKYQPCLDEIASYNPTERGKVLIELLKLFVLHKVLAESMKHKTSIEPMEKARLWLDFDNFQIDLTKYPQNVVSRGNFNDSRFISEFRKMTAKKVVLSEAVCRDILRAIRDSSSRIVFFDKKLTKPLLAPLSASPGNSYLAELRKTKEHLATKDAFLHRGDYWGQSRIHLRDALNKFPEI